MIRSVCAAITPRAAARLLISGEIDLTEENYYDFLGRRKQILLKAMMDILYSE